MRYKNSTLRNPKSEGNHAISRTELEENKMNYFKNLFIISGPIYIPISITFPKVVSRDMNNLLTQQPLEEEVRAILFSLSSGKSSGLDEIISDFFRKL